MGRMGIRVAQSEKASQSPLVTLVIIWQPKS